MLTKTELLFVRACKAKVSNEDCRKRVNSVYRRFYGTVNPTSPLGKRSIMQILFRIVDKINPYTALEAFEVYGKHEIFVVPTLNHEQYLEKVFDDVITRIALTGVSDIEGWISPCRFK